MAKKSKSEKLKKSIRPGRGIILSILILLVVSFFIPIGYVVDSIVYDSTVALYITTIIYILIAVIIAFIIEKINAKKRKYISIIEKQRILSIDEIASVCGSTYEKVNVDIIKMINKGFFGDSYIDNSTRQIVLPNSNVSIYTQVSKRTMECPTCGATVTVYSHKENKCEYCGTLLKF